MGASAVLSLPMIRVLALLASIQGALATFLLPGFHFVYNDDSSDSTLPISAQCDRINLMWSRGTNDTGPPPVAPYFFQVYTSTSETPYVVDAGFGPTFEWDVPFAPNTQYQICMFDSNGSSGGCRETYTVITNTTVSTPTCQNVTAPSELSVTGTVPLGAISQHSYIDQCSSLSVTPQSGKPPFTLTVAPSCHPPYNVTSNTMDPISWQVSLPVGYHFFMALSSSDGLLWGNGPMRVGGMGSTDCLSPGSIPQSTVIPIVVGTGIGGVVLGLAIGVLAYFLFIRVRRRRQRSPSQNYFASQHFSSTKPYKAPSIVPSTIATSSAPQRAYQHIPPSTQNQTLNPEPPMPTSLGFSRSTSYSPSLPTISDATSYSTHTSRTARDLPEVPLEPLRSHRETGSHLSHSHSEPSVIATSDSGSVTEQNHYPLDVKVRLQPFAISTPDDAASVASSNSYARSSLRRAPTYASTSASARHPRNVYVIDENEVPDVPPEYGRHTDDTSCTPSIISSGLGRIPSSYISSGGRF